MNNRLIILFCIILLFGYGFSAPVYSQEASPQKIKTITDFIDRYKGKELTMTLRLKHYDSIFKKITFYDYKNHDLVFDISKREKMKSLQTNMKNLHPGMEYRVTFVVQKRGASGLVIAELIKFTPVIVEKIP